MPFKLTLSYIRIKQQALEKKALALGHVIVWSEYKQILDQANVQEPMDFTIPGERQACLKVICNKHANPADPPIKTNVNNYLRSRTGLTCCGNQSKVILLKGRTFTAETLQQMSDSAQKRKRKGSQDVRDSGFYRTWREATVKNWNSTCQVRGVQSTSLVVHHFFSMTHFTSLRFIEDNGVVLDDVIHNIFHKIYGFKKPVTLDCFIMFVNDLLTDENFRLNVFGFLEASATSDTIETGEVGLSSGDNQGVDAISNQTANAEGSETRAFRVETLGKLHEHVVQLRQVLESLLTEEELILNDKVRQRIDQMSLEERTTFVLKPRN